MIFILLYIMVDKTKINHKGIKVHYQETKEILRVAL